MKQGAVFTVELFKIDFKKNGEGRIQLDFGEESNKEVMSVLDFKNKYGGMFELALVPMPERSLSASCDEYIPDEDGVIPL